MLISAHSLGQERFALCVAKIGIMPRLETDSTSVFIFYSILLVPEYTHFIHFIFILAMQVCAGRLHCQWAKTSSGVQRMGISV